MTTRYSQMTQNQKDAFALYQRRRRGNGPSRYSRNQTGAPLGHVAAAIIEVAIAHAGGKIHDGSTANNRPLVRQDAIRYLRGETGVLALHVEAAGLNYSTTIQEAIASKLAEIERT